MATVSGRCTVGWKEAEWKKSIEGKESESGAAAEKESEEDLLTEVRRLRKELKMSELHNEFLNELIDIAGREMGVDIRKKGGSRRR